MLTRIIMHDWRTLQADRTLWAVAALLAATIAYGAFNGAAWVRFQRHTLAAAAAEERDRLAGVKAEIDAANAGSLKVSPFADPRLPGAVGRTLGVRYAQLPPAPLAALAIGQSDLHPYYFKVNTQSRQNFLNNDEIEHPVHLLSGRFDLAFVILYLYPLVILALTYNLLSAEKESGTLAMTLSQPVTPASLVTGKIAARFAFVLGLATLLSLAGIALGGAGLTGEGSLFRLLLWIAVVAAYGAFWFAAGAAVNACGWSSAANAMAGAGIWLFFVLLVPSLLNVVVKATHPVPSRVELINAMRVASGDAAAQGSRLLARYLEDHPELSGVEPEKADFNTLAIATQDAVERQVQPLLDEFDRRLEQQQAMVDRYRFLSPAIAAQTALYEIAGTSTARYQHFLSLAAKFHEAWRGHFYPKILARARFGPGDIDQLPVFRYYEEPTAAVAGRVVAALPALLFPGLLAAAAGFLALRRYHVAG